MHKNSWLRHGKRWDPRPVGYFVDDFMDYHHQLVCVILPSPSHSLPTLSAPHHELLQTTCKSEGWSLQLSAVSGTQVFGVLCSKTVTVVSCWWPQEGLTCWKGEMWGDLDAVHRSLQKSVAKSTEQENDQGQCFNFLLHLSCWMTEMKVCFLNWTLTLVSHPGCEGIVPPGRCLWSCPSDFAEHESSSQIVILCLQTSFNGAMLYPPYPLTPKELLHLAGEHHWYLVLLSFVWPIKAQTSTGHSLKTVLNLSNTWSCVDLSWEHCKNLPLSFWQVSSHMSKLIKLIGSIWWRRYKSFLLQQVIPLIEVSQASTLGLSKSVTLNGSGLSHHKKLSCSNGGNSPQELHPSAALINHTPGTSHP